MLRAWRAEPVAPLRRLQPELRSTGKVKGGVVAACRGGGGDRGRGWGPTDRKCPRNCTLEFYRAL